MADTKITALAAITTVTPANDLLPIVDVDDHSMAASGTTKNITVNQILGAGGTATLASATITGAATVGTTFGVTGVSTFAAGTALLPALTTTGDTNTGIYYPAADTFAVTTAGTERYRVDSTGNVGIGVTPSAWAGIVGIQSAYGALSGNTNVNILRNAYYNGGWKYTANGRATQYQQDIASHIWYYDTGSQVAGDACNFTPAMTLDASGRLLVGPTSANASGGCLQLKSGITFPATQVASSDANTLDDYEEGSWTPVVADASTGGNTGTCTINTAKYVKIGRQVSVQCDISGITTTGMTAGNGFIIRGLPFAAVQGGNGAFYTYRVSRNASTVSSSAFVGDSQSVVQFYLYSTNSATTDMRILVSDIVSTTSQIILSLTYFV